MSSTTGQKLAWIHLRFIECFEAQKAMAKELGFSQFRPAQLPAAGGISSVRFDSPPDPKIWARFNEPGEYRPNLTSAEGKEIELRFQLMPTVDPWELNACVGLHQDVLGHIGFAIGHPVFYGFNIPKKWDFRPPPDCQEITSVEFRQLFQTTDRSIYDNQN